MGDKAFIASIKNKTVITTVKQGTIKRQCIYKYRWGSYCITGPL